MTQIIESGGVRLAELELFEEIGNWNLATASAELSPEEFDIHLTANTFEIDLYGNRLSYSLADEGWQLTFDLARIELDERSFSRLLDPELRRDYTTQPKLLEFIRRAIRHLTETRDFTMAHLLRAKYQLIRALDCKIKSAYRHALARGYQAALFAPTSRVEASFDYTFQFPTDAYAPVTTYKGVYRFRKHYYASIGDLSTTGEEFDCAVALDSLPQVKYWVRNLSRQPSSSFWLPTSTDRFYPDFVAMLEDGRILVLEYKGALIEDTADTVEKQNIGELWQEKGDKKGLFLMAFKKDDKGRNIKRQIMDKIGAITP